MPDTFDQSPFEVYTLEEIAQFPVWYETRFQEHGMQPKGLNFQSRHINGKFKTYQGWIFTAKVFARIEEGKKSK